MVKDKIRAVRLTEAHSRKWDNLASRLGVSPNHLITVLIDNAEVVGEPKIAVAVKENRNTPTFQGERVAAGCN